MGSEDLTIHRPRILACPLLTIIIQITKLRARQNVLLKLENFVSHLGRDIVYNLKNSDIEIP